jgi:hypothetical protein
MVQARQSFVQPLSNLAEKVLFDQLPVNDDPSNYVLTHAAIALAASGLYECSYSVNVAHASGVGGTVTAYVLVQDNSGNEVAIRESVSYVHVDSTGPKATLHNSFQINLEPGAVKVFIVFDGPGEVNTLPSGAILTLNRL